LAKPSSATVGDRLARAASIVSLPACTSSSSARSSPALSMFVLSREGHVTTRPTMQGLPSILRYFRGSRKSFQVFGRQNRYLSYTRYYLPFRAPSDFHPGAVDARTARG